MYEKYIPLQIEYVEGLKAIQAEIGKNLKRKKRLVLHMVVNALIREEQIVDVRIEIIARHCKTNVYVVQSVLQKFEKREYISKLDIRKKGCRTYLIDKIRIREEAKRYGQNKRAGSSKI